jgi:hypothetical protein
MEELQHKFKQEFDKTSSNRFRTSTDMQYSFSYYYFVMSELDEFDKTKLFDEIDLNMNGLLDSSEIMIANLRISSRPFSVNAYSYGNEAPPAEMFNLNSDFAGFLSECISNSSLPNNSLINKAQFIECDSLVEFLK